MTAQFRISVGLTFLLSLLLAISVQAQTDAVLAVDVISGSIEISIDGGTTYATAATGMQLEPNHQVRWSDDAAGSLIGRTAFRSCLTVRTSAQAN